MFPLVRRPARGVRLWISDSRARDFRPMEIRFMARPAIAIAIIAFQILALSPRPADAQSNSILDRVRERAASRAATETENRANQEVDKSVDKTMDCAFNPIECAKKAKPETAPATGEVGSAPPADTTQWYAEKDGARVGPLPRDQLATMVTSGQITPSTLVWREGHESVDTGRCRSGARRSAQERSAAAAAEVGAATAPGSMSGFAEIDLDATPPWNYRCAGLGSAR